MPRMQTSSGHVGDISSLPRREGEARAVLIAEARIARSTPRKRSQRVSCGGRPFLGRDYPSATAGAGRYAVLRGRAELTRMVGPGLSPVLLPGDLVVGDELARLSES